jgi:rare lipoprotein A
MINKYIFALIIVFSSCQLFSQNYEQTGKCTYYANKFQGRHTSCGDHYDKNLYTAAHRKLPFNTFVKVTNTKNNKSVVVRINDRGPFSKSLIIDLSRVAAEDLDIIAAGVALCKVEVVANPTREDSLRSYSSQKQLPEANKKQVKPEIKKEKPVIAAKVDNDKFVTGKYYDDNFSEADPKGYGLQMGFYKNLNNCKSAMSKYSNLFKKTTYFHVETRSGVKHYKLIIGQFGSKKEAMDFQKEVLKEEQSFIVNY